MLTSKFWRRYFRVYDSLVVFPPYQDLLNTICNELEIGKGNRVLDAGCGTGNLSLKMQGKGAEVIGLDFCEEALIICRKKNPNIRTVLADLTKPLPFPNDYFDKIGSNNVLYTISQEKQAAVLQELNRILKPKGKLAISNPKKGWSALKIYTSGFKKSLLKEGFLATIKKTLRMFFPTIEIFYYNYLIRRERHYHFFQPSEQRNLLLQAGFKNVSKDILLYGKQSILNIAVK